ncbi:hypothetical protein TNCV_313721 [Trichonephila clavipes]|nr:hypothetical protein TNCV_313721 [Trichonephila clavipes]
MKKWGYTTKQELSQFTPVVNKKQNNHSPSKNISLAKKIKTSCETNMKFSRWKTHLSKNKTTLRLMTWRSPIEPQPQCHMCDPPITIDNVAQLLKNSRSDKAEISRPSERKRHEILP